MYAGALAGVLAQGKITSIYTAVHKPSAGAHDFVMLWKQRGFLTSRGNKTNGPYVRELLFAILLPGAL